MFSTSYICLVFWQTCGAPIVQLVKHETSNPRVATSPHSGIIGTWHMDKVGIMVAYPDSIYNNDKTDKEEKNCKTDPITLTIIISHLFVFQNMYIELKNS